MRTTCPHCNCRTVYDDRCQWCSKPLLTSPRMPTEQERDTHTGTTSRMLKGAQRRYYVADPTLLTEIEAFCRATGMTNSRFGKLALKNASFVHNLRDGKAPKPETCARVRQFMRGYNA